MSDVCFQLKMRSNFLGRRQKGEKFISKPVEKAHSLSVSFSLSRLKLEN